MPDTFDLQAFLAETLREFGCQTGTIHRTGANGRTLELVASAGLPEALLPRISSIPFGKGIAGAAAETRQPVELCNLQQDLGGVAKPGARATGVSGSLAVPVFDAAGNVAGTLGIGMPEPHDFTEEEKLRLAGRAEILAPQLAGGEI
jgi:L-methionine (R)-S-oxide reductase